MRTLHIKREKSSVGCLGKVKVYISDRDSTELTINKIPCRLLGTLKNGEEKDFSIPEAGGRIYVISDKLSKEYCNDYWDFAPGTENLYLAGSCRYDPSMGNAFLFNGERDRSVIEGRQKKQSKHMTAVIIFAIIGILIAFGAKWLSDSLDQPEEAVFSGGGMQITLTEEFTKSNEAGFDFFCSSNYAAVFALQEPFADFDSFADITLEEYTQLLLEANDLDVPIAQEGPLYYFEYHRTNPQDNKSYYYLAVTYKEEDAFWMVQFSTLETNESKYRSQFLDWAGGVSFT